MRCPGVATYRPWNTSAKGTGIDQDAYTSKSFKMSLAKRLVESRCIDAALVYTESGCAFAVDDDGPR